MSTARSSLMLLMAAALVSCSDESVMSPLNQDSPGVGDEMRAVGATSGFHSIDPIDFDVERQYSSSAWLVDVQRSANPYLRLQYRLAGGRWVPFGSDLTGVVQSLGCDESRGCTLWIADGIREIWLSWLDSHWGRRHDVARVSLQSQCDDDLGPEVPIRC